MLAFIAASVIAMAAAQGPGRYCPSSSGLGEASFFNEDSQRVILRISEEHVFGTPTWTPGESPVPLSPDDAYKAAITHIRKTRPNIKGLHLEEIALKPVTCGQKNHGYYSITWVVRPEPTVYKGFLKLAVLLNGKILEPIATTP